MEDDNATKLLMRAKEVMVCPPLQAGRIKIERLFVRMRDEGWWKCRLAATNRSYAILNIELARRS
jgi:hypothetical protein